MRKDVTEIKEIVSLFLKWYDEELKRTKVRIPSAVCLSTIGVDNFPNARFVSFKEVVDNAFIITGSFTSRKGIEIAANNNVSLTFWWATTERQIRIQGLATKMPQQLAEKYFNKRSIYSKAVSSICEQGKEVENLELLENKIRHKVVENAKISKPKNWGAYAITPVRVEFMEFKETRFHDRKLYEIENDIWRVKHIQP